MSIWIFQWIAYILWFVIEVVHFIKIKFKFNPCVAGVMYPAQQTLYYLDKVQKDK